MMCIDGPVQIAVVDRVEEGWAAVELSSGGWVDVPLSRLPAETAEGREVCYCPPRASSSPRVFRRCPPSLVPVFSNQRRTLWGQ